MTLSWVSHDSQPSVRHGPLESCPIAQYEHLALAYLNAPEFSEKREEMERRYGKTNLTKMLAIYQEEKANLDYLRSSATQCPGCRCYVEKNMGCNHVSSAHVLASFIPNALFTDDLLEMLATLLLPMR